MTAVADSSFIFEALMKKTSLFDEEDIVVSPEFAIYEIANSLWKHEFLLKDIKNGANYVSLLMGLVESGSIILIRPDAKLMKSIYEIVAKEKITIYDASFLALAKETGLELKSLDQEMIRIFKSEQNQQEKRFRRSRSASRFS